MIRLSCAALLILGVPGVAAARDCRPPADLPPGVRGPDQPGCQARKAPGEPRAKRGREPGFVDLGAGTEVRISGRVRFEAGVRR